MSFTALHFRLFRPAFWAAALFAFVMAILPRPPALPGEPSDKLQHIMAFMVLAGLASAAYRRNSMLRIGAALSAFGAVIELVQLIPALGRDGDWIDWVADTLAVGATLALFKAAEFLLGRSEEAGAAPPHSRDEAGRFQSAGPSGRAPGPPSWNPPHEHSLARNASGRIDREDPRRLDCGQADKSMR